MSAMQVELTGLEKKLQDADSDRFANGRIFQGRYQGEPLVWVISGIGRVNAERAISEVARSFQVDSLLVLGFAGGLSPKLGIGDLVICRNIWSLDPGRLSYQPDAGMVGTATRVVDRLNCRTFYTDCLTVENLFHVPDQKAAMYTQSKCDIVEMENFWMAEQASRLGLRLLAVRAISDSAQDSLPDFDRIIDSSGEISFFGGLRYFARHPQEIKLLPGLHRNSKLARKNLLEFLAVFTQELAIEKGNLEYAH